jgi:hypothetical protein
MKIVGQRRPRELARHPTGELLAEGARANEALLSFPASDLGFIPKGVYHFRTLAEANRHWDDCLAKAMALRQRSIR